jgi:glucokinase
MYIGVDVGGTKTLVSVFTQAGKISEQVKFPTPKSYAHFLLELRHTLAHLKTREFSAGAIALPGRIDREHGRGISMGNLAWKNVNVQHDLEHICHCPFVVENDAKLAGLSEALVLKDRYASVLYVTISTGIGIALIVDGKIDTHVGDGGGRSMLVEHRGKRIPWEDFAGGRAIVERYHKFARDITDPADWEKICRDIAKGLIEVIAMTEPDVIVFGGSVGSYFDRYGKLLAAELNKYHLPMMPKLPPLRQAAHPEEAVVYGCFDMIKQAFPHHAAPHN